MGIVIYEFFSCSFNIPRGLSAYICVTLPRRLKYMLFTRREIRIGKNCARGLAHGTQDRGHSFFPIRTDLGLRTVLNEQFSCQRGNKFKLNDEKQFRELGLSSVQFTNRLLC